MNVQRLETFYLFIHFTTWHLAILFDGPPRSENIIGAQRGFSAGILNADSQRGSSARIFSADSQREFSARVLSAGSQRGFSARVLSAGAQHDEDLNPGSFDLEPNALAIELSCCLITLSYPAGRSLGPIELSCCFITLSHSFYG